MMAAAEPASTPQVIRIPRSDDPSSFVLIRVVHYGKHFDLVATEGDNPYTTKIRQNDLRHLRAKNFQGSDDDWYQIMLHVFFSQVDLSAKQSELTVGVESSASIVRHSDGDGELVITIRKRIQDITQRLGSVPLRQDDEQAIQLFEWTDMAVATTDSLKEQYMSLLCRYHAAEANIDQLKKQLEEFVQAKDEHEVQLMANFAQLLNEKKLKIRNQQRLLASANPDMEKLSEIQTVAFGRQRTPGSKSRTTKRSARQMTDGDPQSEQGIEKMEFDVIDDAPSPEKHRDIDEEQSTPQPLTDDGDDITDSESLIQSFAGENRDGGNDATSTPQESTRRPSLKQPALLPPRRELPFSRGIDVKASTPGRPSRPYAAAEDTAGETDDDEL